MDWYERALAEQVAESQLARGEADAYSLVGDSHDGDVTVSRHTTSAGRIVIIARNGRAQRSRTIPDGAPESQASRVYCECCRVAATL